jgi:2-polyprenyl-3-methyl-5-hydroxy-6-metoxy-1,4-benzoquinol methylase
MNALNIESKDCIEERISCCLVRGDPLEHLYTFFDFPVFMGCTELDADTDITFDMEWCVGRSSGLIQLRKLLPLNVLYGNSHGSGEIGAVWDRHHTAFSKFILKFEADSIFEIGGGHGILAKKFLQQRKVTWTILEPNPTPIDDCPAVYIKGFFDEKFQHDSPIDIVIHSHVIEHMYDPLQFMQNLCNFVKVGSKLCFTLPNMEKMLEKKYTNCLNFEHTYFITEPYIYYLLNNFGFTVIDKEYFLDDHSIFFAAERNNSITTSFELPSNLYANNKLIFDNYIQYYKQEIVRINYLMENTKSKNIYIFGAHIFTQSLISFGLDVKKVVSLLDNDRNKENKRLYGTNLIVQSPKCLIGIKEPIIILKAGVYNDEIRKDILENINSSAIFFE